MSEDNTEKAPVEVSIITTQSVTYTRPVFENGKMLTEKLKVGNREKVVPVVDRFEHSANEVITVDEALARELVKAGLARPIDVTLDEVDPTKSGEDALA